MDIKRGSEVVYQVSIDESTVFTQQLMGEHKVEANWISSVVLGLQLGDYVEVNAEKLYLNFLPQIQKINNFTYRHTAVFEAEVYKLYNKILMDEGSSDFTYFGDPELYLQLIIDNLNSIDSGWTFNLDLPVTYGPKSIAFNQESCRYALTRILEEFKLEFRLSQKEIIVRQDVGFASTYTFEYGRGKGLYSIERQSVTEKGLITRLYAFGGDKNLSSGYRGGARRLIFDSGGHPYIEANTSLFGIKEGSVIFEDIYPKRTGAVTHVTANNSIRDITLDFNINDHLISGVIAKIVFKSGALSGYEFDILNYDHATQTITFIPKEEANGAVIPDEGSFQPEVDDQYTLVNIDMPTEYFEAAEAELLVEAQSYLDTVKSPRVIYTMDIDEKFNRTYGVELACGMQVTISDSELGIDSMIRIFSISLPLVNPKKITAQIADGIPYTTAERIIKDVKQTKTEVVQIDRTREENYREGAVRFRNLQTKIYDPDGYFNGENIRPNSIETLMLSVGAKSQNFLLNLVEIEANYQGDPNKLRISSGSLIHLEIQIEGLGYIWAMDAQIFEALTPASYYYVYARCNSSALTGTWVLSETPINTESEAGFYHFWLGLLYPVNANNQRFFMFTKGMTYIVGDTITTGKIQSLDGLNFFDVTLGKFNLGNETSGLDWDITNEGALTIRGAVIASAILAEDGYIANLKVKSLKTADSGKRMEILAFSDPEETIPVHHQKFYDEDGNLALTIDTEMDAGYVAESIVGAGIKIEKNGSSRKTIITQNGIMSDGSFMSYPSGLGQAAGSIIGVLKASVFSAFGWAAGVIGWDGDPDPNVPTYGGYFNTLFAGGLNWAVRQVTGNYTATLEDTELSCYSSSPITINLPPNPYKGKVILVRRNASGTITVQGNGNNIRLVGLVSSANMDASGGVGRTAAIRFDGSSWLWNFWQV